MFTTIPSREGVRLPTSWLLTGAAEIVVVAGLYAVAAFHGLAFAIPPGNASAVWPPSGIALAALILRSNRVLPGIWIGAFVANCQTAVSPVTAASMATGNTLAAMLASHLCHRCFDTQNLWSRPRDAFLWLLIAAGSCTVAASVGVASLYFSEHVTRPELLVNWFTWWLGDLTGMMIVAPFLIVMVRWALNPRKPEHVLETIASFALLTLVCLCLFAGWLPEGTAEGLLYLPLIIVLWLLLRCRLECVLTANQLIAIIAIWGTSRGVGAFATEADSHSLLDLQMYLNTYALMGLVLNAVLTERREHEQRRMELSAKVESNALQMSLARDIQRALYPREALRDERYICAGTCRAAEAAAGDYFDYELLPDGKLAIMLGDVSGHGFGTALLMTQTRAYTRALLRSQPNLVDVMRTLNEYLCDDTRVEHFVTFVLVRFDPPTGEFEYLGAGHDAIVIHADGTTKPLYASTIPLGLSRDIEPVSSTTHTAQPGDRLVICTDGFAEALSPKRELFGRQQLLDLFIRHREADPEELLRLIMRETTRHSHSETPHDDQTAIVLGVL